MSDPNYVRLIAVVPISAALWHLYIAARYQEIRAPNGTIRRADEPFKFWFAVTFASLFLAFAVQWFAGWTGK